MGKPYCVSECVFGGTVYVSKFDHDAAADAIVGPDGHTQID